MLNILSISIAEGPRTICLVGVEFLLLQTYNIFLIRDCKRKNPILSTIHFIMAMTIFERKSKIAFRRQPWLKFRTDSRLNPDKLVRKLYENNLKMIRISHQLSVPASVSSRHDNIDCFDRHRCFSIVTLQTIISVIQLFDHISYRLVFQTSSSAVLLTSNVTDSLYVIWKLIN